VKTNRVTWFSLAALLALAAATGYASWQMIRARDSYRAERAMYRGLAAVRQLQIAGRALQSERADIRAVRRDWDGARAGFDAALDALDAALSITLPDRTPLERIANTWSRMEGAQAEIASTLTILETQGVLARIGNSGLLITYQEMLRTPEVADRDLGELGLLLFRLEQADRLVIEIEFELRHLSQALQARTSQTVHQSTVAAVASVAVAFAVVLGLLWRIAALYATVAADNVARRSAEQAARASESDLRTTLNAIADAVLAADAHGRLSRTNPAATELCGVSAEDAGGQPLRDLVRFVSASRREPLPHPVDQVIESRAVVEIAEDVLLVQRDGAERRVSAVAAPILDTSQAVAGVVLAIRDVTESARLAEQLRRAQRLESLGQLAGGVAHDFNNILQVLKANISFLEEDRTISEASRSYLAEMDQVTDRAADLTRQLLALGRRQTLQTRPLDLAEHVRAVLKLASRVLGEHIEIGFGCEPDLPCVVADASQIEQVVLNLCVNARDAMPGGGSLRIDLAKAVVGEEQVRAWPWASTGRYVRLSVTDSGVGIPEEAVGRIFEPFFTTKPIGKGTGLGLSVVQGIVQQHRGFIGVYSKAGLGTTFRVFLPAHAGPEPPLLATPGPPRSSRASMPATGTLLLAEDEEAVRRVAMSILERRGYRVLPAIDGEDALAVARANIDSIQMAVVDVVMPRLGGIELARRLQALKPGLPLLLCTGYAGGLEITEENAAWSLLLKPYSSHELLQAVERAVAGSRRFGATHEASPSP
jgi:PAS domain S-box-containing protein